MAVVSELNQTATRNRPDRLRDISIKRRSPKDIQQFGTTEGIVLRQNGCRTRTNVGRTRVVVPFGTTNSDHAAVKNDVARTRNLSGQGTGVTRQTDSIERKPLTALFTLQVNQADAVLHVNAVGVSVVEEISVSGSMQHCDELILRTVLVRVLVKIFTGSAETRIRLQTAELFVSGNLRPALIKIRDAFHDRQIEQPAARKKLLRIVVDVAVARFTDIALLTIRKDDGCRVTRIGRKIYPARSTKFFTAENELTILRVDHTEIKGPSLCQGESVDVLVGRTIVDETAVSTERNQDILGQRGVERGFVVLSQMVGRINDIEIRALGKVVLSSTEGKRTTVKIHIDRTEPGHIGRERLIARIVDVDD